MDERTAALLADEDARASMAAAEFDRDFLRAHLTDERRKAALLGEIREAIFGAQDGLISTVAVVNFVAGASQDPYYVLVAGFAAALGGVFSMAAGEYISSKSQREIFDAQIVDERDGGPRAAGRGGGRAGLHVRGGRPATRARARGGADHGRAPGCAAEDDGREGAEPRRRRAVRLADAGRARHGRRLRPRQPSRRSCRTCSSATPRRSWRPSPSRWPCCSGSGW